MVELKATYPYGEALGGIVVPGNTRALAVQGAALAIVDLTNFETGGASGPAGEPKVLRYVEIPDVTTLAMKYRLGAQGQRAVYLAGGSTGLWKVDLCDSLFTSSAPPPCSVPTEIVDRVGCESLFAWKRCVDVEVIEGHFGSGGDGLLVALFAASSDVRKRAALTQCPGDLGANELRAYRIASNGTLTLHAAHLLDEGGANPISPVEQVGTALASDPGDPSVIYVALGAGGVWKVTIGAAAPAVVEVPFTGLFPCALPDYPVLNPSPYAGGTGCPAGEQVRDLAIVRTPSSGPLLYAAMEYGRLVEVRLQPGSVTHSQQTFNIYFPMRVAAYADGDEVLVAVGFNDGPGVSSDSTSPYRPTGVWSDMCIHPGIEEVNNIWDPLIPKTARVTRIRLLARNASTSLAPLAGVGDLQVSERWNALEFVPTGASNRVRLYASTSVRGLDGWKAQRTQATTWAISPAWGVPPTVGVPFAGRTFTVGDPTVSQVNPALGGAGFDGWGAEVEGQMFRVVSTGGVTDLEAIPMTVSACSTRDESFPTIHCAGDDPILSDPRPFVLQSGSSSPCWIDPYDASGQTEWFVSGDEMIWHAIPPATCANFQSCAWQPDSVRCVTDPCTTGLMCSSWGRKAIPGAVGDVGWRITRLKTGAASTGVITGVNMEMDWWQLPSNNVGSANDPRALTVPYTTSSADPRTYQATPNSAPVPRFVYLVRNGATKGIKIVRTQWIMDRARGLTPACTSSHQGNGEPLGSPAPPAGWGASSDLEMLSLQTHLELGGPCRPLIDGAYCYYDYSIVWNEMRRAFNNKAHIFSVPVAGTPGQTRWVLAVTAGFVATGSTADASCVWKPYFRRALTVFYDVTDLNETQAITSQNSPLLAAAIGPDPSLEPVPSHPQLPAIVPSFETTRSSHAYSIRTRQYTQPGGGVRTLAFVGDLLGRVLVYDVSWDKLTQIPGPGVLPLPNNPSKPLLQPSIVHRFAADPFDGWRPNCTDLEIDENILYCATVRNGVHLLEIGPAMPVGMLPTYGVLDTPGMATGITFRRPDALNRQLDQMLVGDNRCGLRLYARLGN